MGRYSKMLAALLIHLSAKSTSTMPSYDSWSAFYGPIGRTAPTSTCIDLKPRRLDQQCSITANLTSPNLIQTFNSASRSTSKCQTARSHYEAFIHQHRFRFKPFKLSPSPSLRDWFNWVLHTTQSLLTDFELLSGLLMGLLTRNGESTTVRPHVQWPLQKLQCALQTSFKLHIRGRPSSSLQRLIIIARCESVGLSNLCATSRAFEVLRIQPERIAEAIGRVIEPQWKIYCCLASRSDFARLHLSPVPLSFTLNQVETIVHFYNFGVKSATYIQLDFSIHQVEGDDRPLGFPSQIQHNQVHERRHHVQQRRNYSRSINVHSQHQGPDSLRFNITDTSLEHGFNLPRCPLHPLNICGKTLTRVASSPYTLSTQAHTTSRSKSFVEFRGRSGISAHRRNTDYTTYRVPASRMNSKRPPEANAALLTLAMWRLHPRAVGFEVHAKRDIKYTTYRVPANGLKACNAALYPPTFSPSVPTQRGAAARRFDSTPTPFFPGKKTTGGRHTVDSHTGPDVHALRPRGSRPARLRRCRIHDVSCSRGQAQLTGDAGSFKAMRPLFYCPVSRNAAAARPRYPVFRPKPSHSPSNHRPQFRAAPTLRSQGFCGFLWAERDSTQDFRSRERKARQLERKESFLPLGFDSRRSPGPSRGRFVRMRRFNSTRGLSSANDGPPACAYTDAPLCTSSQTRSFVHRLGAIQVGRARCRSGGARSRCVTAWECRTHDTRALSQDGCDVTCSARESTRHGAKRPPARTLARLATRSEPVTRLDAGMAHRFDAREVTARPGAAHALRPAFLSTRQAGFRDSSTRPKQCSTAAALLHEGLDAAGAHTSRGAPQQRDALEGAERSTGAALLHASEGLQRDDAGSVREHGTAGVDGNGEKHLRRRGAVQSRCAVRDAFVPLALSPTRKAVGECAGASDVGREETGFGREQNAAEWCRHGRRARAARAKGGRVPEDGAEEAFAEAAGGGRTPRDEGRKGRDMRVWE
ncbi:hypothetical protein C8R43DRAFT_952424 [Mycena crocata]|nr:hypothetical protein C8R43DRAFT_952424 [Mycena crocata]